MAEFDEIAAHEMLPTRAPKGASGEAHGTRVNNPLTSAGLQSATRSGAPFAGMYDETPLRTQPVHEDYNGENEEAMFRKEATDIKSAVKRETGTDVNYVSTHYMSDAERKASEIGVKNGKILDANGALLDTTKASGIGTCNEEAANKHIFVMNNQGTFRQADPWANKKIGQKAGEDGWQGVGAHLIQHSSFESGQAVAGAGEMRVEKGELQQISDQSGHYRPDGTMVKQALDKLELDGVNMDKTSMKFAGKTDTQAPVYCSPTQFRQHDAATAEQEIRSEKEKMRNELQKAVAARRANRVDKRESEDVRYFMNVDGVVKTPEQHEADELAAQQAEQAERNRSYKRPSVVEAATIAEEPTSYKKPVATETKSSYHGV